MCRPSTVPAIAPPKLMLITRAPLAAAYSIALPAATMLTFPVGVEARSGITPPLQVPPAKATSAVRPEAELRARPHPRLLPWSGGQN